MLAKVFLMSGFKVRCESREGWFVCVVVFELREVMLVGRVVCGEQVLASPAAKKAVAGSEIPTPQFVVVDSYERDYTRTFVQPQSYIRARPGKCSADCRLDSAS